MVLSVPRDIEQSRKEDAERLRELFLRKQLALKKAGQPHTQDALAEVFGFGQSALNQYLNGQIPLNADALLLFAKFLGVPPAAISPKIVKEVAEKAAALGIGPKQSATGGDDPGSDSDLGELQALWTYIPKPMRRGFIEQAKPIAEQNREHLREMLKGYKDGKPAKKP